MNKLKIESKSILHNLSSEVAILTTVQFLLEVILNNYNDNSISEKILKNIFKNKIEVIEKIENNKNYNLIINNNLNSNYLDKKTENKYFNIIKDVLKIKI